MPTDQAHPTHFSRGPRRARALSGRVALLDALPELGDRLPPERLPHAGQLRARVVAVRRGAWNAGADAAASDVVAFVVLTGTLLRLVGVRHREAGELLGPGDLVQSRCDDDGVSWRALEDVTLAPIDARLLADTAMVPELCGELMRATAARTNTVARQLVVAQWSSVDERIMAVMELIAERWGVVTRDGVLLPSLITHSVLAPLIGARRPSVTTALQRLARTGAVTRRNDGRWLLAHHAAAPAG